MSLLIYIYLWIPLKLCLFFTEHIYFVGLNNSNRTNNFLFFLRIWSFKEKERKKGCCVAKRKGAPAIGLWCTVHMWHESKVFVLILLLFNLFSKNNPLLIFLTFFFSFSFFFYILYKGKSWSSSFVILTKTLENPTLLYFLNFETFSLHFRWEATCSLSDKASK